MKGYHESPLPNYPGQENSSLVDDYLHSRFSNLRLTEERALQRVVNELPVVAFVYDMTNNRVLFVNDHGAQTLGYVPGEIEQMGPHWSSALLHVQEVKFLHSRLFSKLEDGGTVNVRAHLRDKSGVKVPITFALRTLAPTASHRTGWLLGVVESVSRATTVHSPVQHEPVITAFWEFDVEKNRMTYLSPEIEELTGYERSRWSATGHQFPASEMQEYDKISRAFREASTSKKLFSLEVNIRAAGGRAAPVLLKGSMRDERRLCGSVESLPTRAPMHVRSTQAGGAALQLQKLFQAVEEEKTRTAQFLHDEVGQSATAILLELSSAYEDAEHTDVTTQRAALADISQRVTGLIDSIRLRSRQLMPPSLECGDLRSALRKECADFQRHTGIVCRVRCHFSAQEAWLEEEKVALFRIAQESLNNVRKHAHASAVSITVLNDGGTLRLRVKDNGKGLPSDQDGPDGIGIASMRKRAHSIGCNLLVRNLAEGGAEVLMERQLRS